jgi:hypothetical protein
MSIHDFHSKLMSGKEEGTLFEALRRLKAIATPALAEEDFGWTFWMDTTDSAGAAAGWAVWEEVSGLQA